MTKFSSTEVFYKTFLTSDVGEWRSEIPQEETAQTGRYTYDYMVLEEVTTFLVYIFPEPFSEEKTNSGFTLRCLRKSNFGYQL